MTTLVPPMTLICSTLVPCCANWTVSFFWGETAVTCHNARLNPPTLPSSTDRFFKGLGPGKKFACVATKCSSFSTNTTGMCMYMFLFIGVITSLTIKVLPKYFLFTCECVKIQCGQINYDCKSPYLYLHETSRLQERYWERSLRQNDVCVCVYIFVSL